LGVRAGFSLQSFCSGEEQKGFSLQSLTQTLSKYQNIAFTNHNRSFYNRTQVVKQLIPSFVDNNQLIQPFDILIFQEYDAHKT